MGLLFMKFPLSFQIVLAVARLFWLERKMKKAKEWFIKAVKLNPDLGDTWATYYKFTAAHGTEDELKVLVSLGFDRLTLTIIQVFYDLDLVFMPK